MLVLGLAALFPLALAATASLLYVLHEREQSAQRVALGTARSIAVTLKAEIDAVTAVLEVMAESESLRVGRMERFEERARLVAEMRGWRTVTVADGWGKLLLSTTRPTLQYRPVDPASLQAAIERRVPVVGTLQDGPTRRGPAFAVRVPVVREGQVQHVLSAVVGSEQVLQLLSGQKLPDGQVVAVFDSNGSRVARTVEHSYQGASPSLQALMRDRGREGTGITQTLEGARVHTAFHRIPGLDWTVAVGIPVAEVNRSLLASFLVGLLGLLASLALSSWLAWIYSRKVSRPIQQLKSAAAALGRGEPVSAQRLEIEELDEVGQALVQASRERERSAAERREAEADRERLLAQATDALASAEKAARSKDEFLAVLGHELRNPLAPISTALHLMAMKGDEATRAERRIVERQLGHMTRLVDDLLDVSRITSGKLRIRREPIRVGPWVEQVVETLRTSVGGRRLAVELPPEAAQAWVSGDPVRLAQVLTNLLGNAIKFTADDGSIAVRARREGDQVGIEVIDDGVGLAPEELARVFELFSQAPQAQHRASGGLGLGLAIVRSLVEMHEGRVEAASKGPGLGSIFSVWLPCIEPPAKPQEQTIPPAARTSLDGRVLVVDDNVDAADTAGALLEASGFQVRVAYTPEEALALLDGFQPDVALLDIGLPGMSGYELAQAVRNRPRGELIRLIALTGYGQEADVRRAHEHGFDAHMTKPVDVDALLALVERLSRR